MEISELNTQIKNNRIGSLYFFWGEEHFLIENKIASIKKRVVSGDFSELNFSKIEGKKTTANEIIDMMMSVPIMAERRMIVVQNCGIFQNAKTKEFAKLTEALKGVPPEICMVFYETDFDKKKEKNLDVFKKCGAIVKFDFLSPQQLEVWIEKTFEESGKTILNKDIKEIISRCGQSMAIINNEISKLILFLGERKKVTLEDILLVVSKTTEARVFDMIEMIAAGKGGNAVDEINALKSLGENPSVVITLIAGRFSELLLFKQLMSEGMSSSAAAEYLEPKRPPFVVKKLAAQSERFSEDYLKRMMLSGIEYTDKVRSGKLDKWIAAEMYAAGLSK